MKGMETAGRSRMIGVAMTVLACLAGSAGAADARITALMADKAALARAVAAGGKTASFCFNCHGEDGNSTLPDVPNLAGQNAGYLFVQTGKFVSGERRDEFMQGLMKALTDEDRVNIAVFFSQQALKRPNQGGGPNPAGKTVYDTVCVGCHGAQGGGNDVIPRIAGQQRNYVALSLTRYREKNGRLDPRMSEVAGKLSPSDIRAVAAYVASM